MRTQVKIASESPKFKRKMRSPQHPFNLAVKPWQIQPHFIAPVLPGETMKGLFHMSRVVSDPIKDKLMGWWCEYYYFYVKHTDLDIRSDLVAMHVQNASTAALTSAAVSAHFHNGGINYVSECLEKVLEWYFRDEDEAAPALIAGLPPAKINHDGWWQSMRLEDTATDSEHELPGDNPGIPDGAPAGFSAQYAQWEAMRAVGLTAATFEDYLKSFGVSAPQSEDEELRRPELLRYVKDFTYPSNTVEATTGVPASAAVWSISERADKDRYFAEPGFLFGVQVIRPKVFLSGITGSITSYMGTAYDWLPKIVDDLPWMSLREFAASAGPAPVAYTGTDDYFVDVRDLFLHGEQFYNHAEQKNVVTLPDAAGNVKYATEAMADALFVADTAEKIRTDGIVTLNIASSVHKDMTP